MQQLKVAIIGASLAGPMVARLLRSAGFSDIVVFEAAREARPQSGGLFALQPFVYSSLGSAGLNTRELGTLEHNVQRVYRLSGRVATYDHSTEGRTFLTTSWDVMNSAATRGLDVRYGKKLVDLEDAGDRARAVLVFEDGTRYEADLVIGADGRGSTLRRILDPRRVLNYLGWVIWRGVSEVPYPAFGFHRYNNYQGGLFAVSEPLTRGLDEGKSHWILYQNIARGAYLSQISQTPPDERPYVFPQHLLPGARALMEKHAAAILPDELAAIPAGTREISVVAMNSVVQPTKAFWKVGRTCILLISDALQPISPTSAFSINLGIYAASLLAQNLDTWGLDISLGSWQRTLLSELGSWVQRGDSTNRRYGMGV